MKITELKSGINVFLTENEVVGLIDSNFGNLRAGIERHIYLELALTKVDYVKLEVSQGMWLFKFKRSK